MRQSYRVRRPISSKPDTCTEGMAVYAMDISVKVGVRYPPRSHRRLETATDTERWRDRR